MIDAQRAKELTNAYLIEQNKVYQKVSEQKLADIYEKIEEKAAKGFTVHIISNKVSYFKFQEVETIVRNKLTDLGYTIGASGTSFTIRW